MDVVLKASSLVILGLCLGWLINKGFERREKEKEEDSGYED